MKKFKLIAMILGLVLCLNVDLIAKGRFDKYIKHKKKRVPTINLITLSKKVNDKVKAEIKEMYANYKKVTRSLKETRKKIKTKKLEIRKMIEDILNEKDEEKVKKVAEKVLLLAKEFLSLEIEKHKLESEKAEHNIKIKERVFDIVNENKSSFIQLITNKILRKRSRKFKKVPKKE